MSGIIIRTITSIMIISIILNITIITVILAGLPLQGTRGTTALDQLQTFSAVSSCCRDFWTCRESWRILALNSGVLAMWIPKPLRVSLE